MCIRDSRTLLVYKSQDQGRAKTLRAGDRFVIPAGFKGTWEVLEACRKIYVVFEASDINK